MSASDERPAVTGTGWGVPVDVRTNDDPIFDWIKKHNPHGMELFKGYRDRRVLAVGDGLDTILVPAALQALKKAKVDPADVDMVLGSGSVGPFETPDEIARLPALLGMGPRVWVVPLHDDFSNFNAGLWFADALVRAGRIRTALVLCASDWTRRVDYHTPQSVSASDGAGAAVLSRTGAGGFELIDTETFTDATWFGSMFMRGDEVHRDGERLFTKATFHITDAGQQGFQTFGLNEPPRAVARLLARHGLSGKDVSLVSHQASSVLMDAWKQAIQPAAYLQTLEEFANVTVANIPLNLAYHFDRIATEWVVLLAVGIEMHTNATLLRRV
jgi:3-oxoacyl-[acyl-carrier-protein] synthase-3